MYFIIETFVIFLLSIQLAGFLAAVLLFLAFKMKRILTGMSGKEWQAYYLKIGRKGFFIRLYACFFAALAGIAIFDTIVFWHQFEVYGITLMLAGGFHVYYKFHINRDKINEKLSK